VFLGYGNDSIIIPVQPCRSPEPHFITPVPSILERVTTQSLITGFIRNGGFIIWVTMMTLSSPEGLVTMAAGYFLGEGNDSITLNADPSSLAFENSRPP
jgi:hypothetical protein